MAFLHGVGTQVLIGGSDQSVFLAESEIGMERAVEEVTTYQPGSATSGFTSFVGGNLSSNVSFTGFYDPVDAADGVLFTSLSAQPSPVTVAFEGLAVGTRAKSVSGLVAVYSGTAPVAGAVEIAVEVMGAARIDSVLSHHPLIAETTTNTGFGSIDNTVATANGLGAYLHVTTITGTVPVLTVTVQDSLDGAAYADILSFASTSGLLPQGQSAFLGNGVAVRRHVRIRWVISGTTPSFTFTVLIGRR